MQLNTRTLLVNILQIQLWILNKNCSSSTWKLLFLFCCHALVTYQHIFLIKKKTCISEIYNYYINNQIGGYLVLLRGSNKNMMNHYNYGIKQKNKVLILKHIYFDFISWLQTAIQLFSLLLVPIYVYSISLFLLINNEIIKICFILICIYIYTINKLMVCIIAFINRTVHHVIPSFAKQTPYSYTIISTHTQKQCS